jgi:hypothetical protein
MKKILVFAALLSCVVLSCKHKEKVSPVGLQGVYELEKQVLRGGKTDSTIKREQVKIYTDRHFAGFLGRIWRWRLYTGFQQ